jgi:hypothetical protein
VPSPAIIPTESIVEERNQVSAINDECKTPTRSEVVELLRRHFARTGGGARLPIVNLVRAGRYSVIYRAQRPGEADIAIKCCIDPASGNADSDQAARQYSALERVHQHMGCESTLRVPQPFFLLRRHGIVAMEWIEGDSVTARLLSLRTGSHEAMQLMVRSAQWLRSFHTGGRCAEQPLDVEDKAIGLDSLEASPLCNRRTAREALAALRLHAGAAASRPLEQSWQHGDYKTDNLLVAGNTTVGIDAHVRGVNAVVYDAASFVNHLELTAYHPLGLWLLGRRSKLASKFLEAFDHSYLVANRLPYQWTSLYLMLWNWHEFSRSDVDSMRDRYTRTAFRLVVRRLTRALQNAADGGSVRLSMPHCD